MYKGSKDVVKNLTSGNVGDALSGAGSTALKAISNILIKQPSNLVKNSISAIGNSVKKIFCFAPDTQILMKDNSYKHIQDIKVGDEVALGGSVTAIGTGVGTEFVVINGVHVIETHALYICFGWKLRRCRESLIFQFVLETIQHMFFVTQPEHLSERFLVFEI